MKQTSNFDRIAFAYDFLARLIFGNSIANAQKEFLNQIPSGSRVLIIGGGTGWIINELFQRSKIERLIYVEASNKMLSMAKSKTKKEYYDKIDFVFGTEDEIDELEKVDVVITFFFLDLFSLQEQKILFNKLLYLMKQGGLWLVSDFDYNMNRYWQKVLTKIMYKGFRLLCNVKTSSLEDTQEIFNHYKLKLTEEKYYFREMIFSRKYIC